jgi:hypothetical protein
MTLCPLYGPLPQRSFIIRYNMRILTTTIGFFIKLLRYSGAFRERAWLGRAHRQLPTHNTEESCFGGVSLLFSLTSVAGVCFEFK